MLSPFFISSLVDSSPYWTLHADRRPFLFHGRWWSRGPRGEVLGWDQESAAWMPLSVRETPFFMRRPRFTALRKPAACVYVLLGVFMVFAVVAIVAMLSLSARFAPADEKSVNPKIREIIDAVSEARIKAILEKLERFGTRNTMSNPDDPALYVAFAGRGIVKITEMPVR